MTIEYIFKCSNNDIIINDIQLINNIKKHMDYINQLLDDDINTNTITINLNIISSEDFQKLIDFIPIINNNINKYLEVSDIENISDLYDRDIPIELEQYLSEFNNVNNFEIDYKTFQKLNIFLNHADYLQSDILCDVYNYKIADFIYKIDKSILDKILRMNTDYTDEIINEFFEDLSYIRLE